MPSIISILWGIFFILSGIAIVQRLRGKISLGLDVRGGALAEWAAGFGIGALAMTGVFVVEWALGLLSIVDVQLAFVPFLQAFGLLLGYALYEEVMFRVLMLNGILAVISREWIAVAVTAVMFGLAHIANEGATWLSMSSAAIGGVMYALAFVQTRRIWMPVGLHFAWNLVQGPIWGFPISGTTDWSTLFVRQTAHGSALLTGGVYGPEGGIIGIGFRFVVIALVLLWTRRHAARTWAARRPVPTLGQTG